MDKNYLDDFVCDITCEEYYGDDDDLFWGDQEEQAHAGGMIDVSSYSTNEYHKHNFKLNIVNTWEENAKYANRIYGSPVDWEERFYICPECGEPVYECDWTGEELRAYLCPICEFEEEEIDG